MIRLWKLHERKYIKPILKNSTGDREKPGNLIHLFAPPDAVTIEAGKNGIIAIIKKKNKKRDIPAFPIIFEGSICDKNHIIRIDNVPTKS